MSESAVATVEAGPDAVVIHVQTDRLDEEGLQQLQGLVRAAAEANPAQPVILNLGRVDFLPSMSLASLIRLHTEFQGRRQRLLLAAVQPRVRDVIVMTRLDRFFEMHDDLAAALRATGAA
jgi:anti-anti-sigma factor